MANKKNIAIIFGGKSTEHEISILSSKNVYKNLDRDLYSPILIYISKKGAWYHLTPEDFENEKFDTSQHSPLCLLFGNDGYRVIEQQNQQKLDMDAVFPILHGPNGEDGTIQGLFKLSGIPFVGPGILASSLAMDKIIAKKIFIQEGIPTADFVDLTMSEFTPDSVHRIIDQLKFPMVVKPSRAGSSVGISKVNNQNELLPAIELAFRYDYKILVEKYIKGREIEIAVLGNEKPVASLPGEIVTDFYDYREKYSNESKARLDAPAIIDQEIIHELQQTAIKAFKALDCEGMSRVDFFLTKNGLMLNEINTIPGFTNISMYPKLFEISGTSQKQLITKLIEAAIDRNNKQRQVEHSFNELSQ